MSETFSENSSILGFSYHHPYDSSVNVSWFEVGLSEETAKLKEVKSFLGIELSGLRSYESYLFAHQSDYGEFAMLAARKPFYDPALNLCTYNESLVAKEFAAEDFDYLIQSTLKPGTSDAAGNVALNQALRAINHSELEGDQGFLARTYLVSGELSEEQLSKLSAFLFNPELYQSTICTKAEFQQGKDIEIPVVELGSSVDVETIDIVTMDDQELMQLNSQRKLAASLEEMQGFQSVYKDLDFLKERKKHGLSELVTDVEIETWFGLRSEHCFHKEFNARVEIESEIDQVFQIAIDKGWLKQEGSSLVLERGMFKTFIKDPAEEVFTKLEKRGANWIASMFSDNSGVVHYDDEFMYCLKVETHNSPSNIEPVQGAKTGLNGNFRDIMGTMCGSFDIMMGFFAYCIADPKNTDWLPKGVKHPYVLLKGMTQGVREAGNEMQIPTLSGMILADPRYIAKCLVYCGAVGWSPVYSPEGKYGKKDLRIKQPDSGDVVLLAGQAVGVDGIHGATESSLSASKEISLGHVQADFSFIQVKVKEFIQDAARRGLFTSVTDFGAMGLGSASHEMARSTNGMDLDLSKHPVKYQGIKPWQINCSETQDRMLLVAKSEDLAKIHELAKFYSVDLAELGHLNDSGYIKLTYQDEVVGLFDIQKLFSSDPRKQMLGKWLGAGEQTSVKFINTKDYTNTLVKILANPDVASKNWFYRQKDFSVRGETLQGPLLGSNLLVDSDVALQKPLETEGRDSGAIAYAMASCPKLVDIDPYYSVQKSYYDLLGKLVAFGAELPDMSNPKWDAWAVCGNYCQPNSDYETGYDVDQVKHNLAGLVREGIAVAELVQEFNIPIISGKDSMKCSSHHDMPADFELTDLPGKLRDKVSLIEKDDKKVLEIHDPSTYLISAAVKINDYNKCQNAEFKTANDLVYLVSVADWENLGLAGSIYAEESGQGMSVEDYPQISAKDFKSMTECFAKAHDSGILSSSAYIHQGGLITTLFKAVTASGLGAKIEVEQELLFMEGPGYFLITVAAQNQGELQRVFAGTHLQLIGTVEEGALEINSQKIDLDKASEAYHGTFNY